MNQQISTTNAPGAVGPYSQAILANNTLYVSGQLPINPKTGIFQGEDAKSQAAQSLENIKAILQQAGFSMKDVVKVTVYLDDINDFQAVNEVYETYFSAPFPARSAFEVGALPKNARVEIECIAVKSES